METRSGRTAWSLVGCVYNIFRACRPVEISPWSTPSANCFRAVLSARRPFVTADSGRATYKPATLIMTLRRLTTSSSCAHSWSNIHAFTRSLLYSLPPSLSLSVIVFLLSIPLSDTRSWYSLSLGPYPHVLTVFTRCLNWTMNVAVSTPN